MTIPHHDLFNTFYNDYSITADKISIPRHFDVFAPDNEDDFSCVAVISPSPAKGAKSWTRNGRWLTIGIYRDEGRPTTKRPEVTGVTWGLVGDEMLLTTQLTHDLVVGEPVTVGTVVSFATTVFKVYDNFTFSIIANPPTSSGVTAYTQETPISFYDNYRVFRVLPSFKLLTYAELLQIFADTAPSETLDRRELYNLTSANTELLLPPKTVDLNYALTSQSAAAPLERRFDQVYDEQGAPLKLAYDALGRVIIPHSVDSRFKNSKILFNQPVVNEVDWDVQNGVSNLRVYAYDFYGLDINDPTRAPYFSSDIITRDLTKEAPRDNLLRRELNDGTSIHPGFCFDRFGNRVIGIQETNALMSRQHILPLHLDVYNRPVKTPSSRVGKIVL